MKLRNSFIFYSSYYDAISELPAEEQGKIYKAIIDYAIAAIEPTNLTSAGKMCFKLIKPTIDAALSRYDASVANGKKGGRPKGEKTKTKPNKNLDETQEEPKGNQEKSGREPNLNLNEDIDLDKDLDKDIDSNKLSNDRLVGSVEALEILNEKAKECFDEISADSIIFDFKPYNRILALFEKMSYKKTISINGITRSADKVLWDFIEIFARSANESYSLIIDCFNIVDSNPEVKNAFTYTISVFYNKMKGV